MELHVSVSSAASGGQKSATAASEKMDVGSSAKRNITSANWEDLSRVSVE